MYMVINYDLLLSAVRMPTCLMVVFSIGYVEYTDNTKKQCLIFWRTAEEWSKLIYNWVSVNIIDRDFI